jgi:hypothetical protein
VSNRKGEEDDERAYLGGGGLVASEGEIPDEERARGAPGDGAAVVEHEVERHGERGVVAVDDHGGGVSDEADVDPGGVNVDGGGVVVGGDDGDGLPAAVLAAERGERHAARRLLRARPPVDGGLRHVAQQPPRELPEVGGRPHCVVRRDLVGGNLGERCSDGNGSFFIWFGVERRLDSQLFCHG